MAKNDNLKDFLTDVADAIREKKGTTEKINPQDFSSEIKGIESSGGIVPCEWNDVNFYDYEGTILYSYSWDEFVAKNEMPPLPTHHKGLVCQEWNYTLEDVLEQGGRCDVGAIYTTVSGATEIYLRVGAKPQTLGFTCTPSAPNAVTVDWGDGVVESIEQAKQTSVTHTYSNSGSYVAKINVIKGEKISGLTLQDNDVNCERIFIGENTDLGVKPFGDSFAREITIPKGCVCNNELISAAVYIKHINIPKDFNINSGYWFRFAEGLRTVSLPNTPIILYDNRSFIKCTRLEYIHIPSNAIKPGTGEFASDVASLFGISVSKQNNTLRSENDCLIETESKTVIKGTHFSLIPNSVTSIGAGAFSKTKVIDVVISDSVTTVLNAAFHTCSRCLRFKMSKNINSIGDQAFSYCMAAKIFDFRDSEQIPTLKNSNAFNPTPATCKIIVPDTLYDQWIVATNWSTYASRIVKASDTYIEFVDPVVAQICADNWGDGVGITYNQAAAVSNIGAVFKANENISYFNEFRYFIGVDNIAFEGMHSTSLEEVTLPKNLTILNDYCFTQSPNLKIVKNESSKITSVGLGAFHKCSNLETFLLPVTTPPTLRHVLAFHECPKLTIYVPDDSVEAYKSATNWSDFASIIKPMSEYVEPTNE